MPPSSYLFRFEIDYLEKGGRRPVSLFAGRKSLLKGVKNFPQGRICLLDWRQRESFICIDQKSFWCFFFPFLRAKSNACGS